MTDWSLLSGRAGRTPKTLGSPEAWRNSGGCDSSRAGGRCSCTCSLYRGRKRSFSGLFNLSTFPSSPILGPLAHPTASPRSVTRIRYLLQKAYVDWAVRQSIRLLPIQPLSTIATFSSQAGSIRSSRSLRSWFAPSLPVCSIVSITG